MLFYKEYVTIQSIIAHHIGNKVNQEAILFSKEPIILAEEINDVLLHYFLNAFKSEEFYHFFHDTDLKYNEVCDFVSNIFADTKSFLDMSVQLGKYLYEKSDHPNIKAGEFYVAYFKDCVIGTETVDAIGLFNTQNKDTFLRVYPSGNAFEVESQQGININKLDKGCLIFNTDKENGYVVAVVDNTNKGVDAHYWIDDFLHVRQRQDEYYNTHNVMSMYKTFVTKELPQQFEVTKADQAELINESVKFFKEKDTFNLDDFGAEVLREPEVIKSFNDFSNKYQQDKEIELSDNFTISDSAVKKQARAFKSIIKLDKNFHIYVHGNNQYIKRGYDEATGMHYYQLFFKEEL